MESSRSKLNIQFSLGFLASLCEQIEIARTDSNDELFIEQNVIKSNLFRFSPEREIKLINGRVVSEEEFNKVYADLRMMPTTRALACKSIDNDLDTISNRESIVLINATNSITKQISKERGVLVSGPESIIKDYNILTFDNKFNMPFQIKVNDRKDESFNFQKAFSPYRIPVNKVVLMDPYLYSSDDETIKLNLVELINSLFTGSVPSECPAMEIKVITTFPKDFKQRKGDKFPESSARSLRVAEIKSLLDSSYKTFSNVNFQIICIDLFELNKDNAEIRKMESISKLEKRTFHLSVSQRKTKTLFNLCKDFIHDRWFFTNYYVCDSGRGFSPLVRNKSKKVYIPYWSKMNLFSQLQKEHFLICRTLENELLKLESNKNDLELNKYFYSF